jgi:hypothetical protein
MPPAIERLESQLLARWSRETLEAYGSALRAAGDPRGELIAIDLSDTGDEDRKAELEVAWLGDDVAWAVTTRLGFVEDCLDLEDVLPHLEHVLRYARAFDIHGEPAEVVEALAILGAAPRPWLGALSIRQLDSRASPLVDADLAQRVVAATPHLRKLVVHGHQVLADFAHPGIERLVVDGHDALPALLGRGTLPRVDTLDFALHPDSVIYREPPPDDLRALLPATAFPQLRTLDLSRNEPRDETLAPNCLGGKTPIFELLPHLGVLPQLAQLRVPSVRSSATNAQLQRALERMPSLMTLDIARTYGKSYAKLSHRARISVAKPARWPAGSAIPDTKGVLFLLDSGTIRVDLETAYEICERAELTDKQGDAWFAFWEAAEDDDISMLARADVHRILDTIGDDDATAWVELQDRRDELPRNIAVRGIVGYEAMVREADDEPRAERTRASTASVAEHERELQAAFDLDRLAVYADELQQLGDIRGELIAIELQLARESRPELVDRRNELHEQVFGDKMWIESTLGFASVKVSAWGDDEDTLASFLDGDAARYLASVDLGGPVQRVVRDVKVLASARRPWLRKLAIETLGGVDEPPFETRALLDVWPLLEELELVSDDPTALLRDFTHANVHTLRITGWPAFAGIGAPWPAVRTLDLAYGGGLEPPDDPIGYLGDANVLPRLRVLDLSRNEPSLAGALLDRDHDRFQAGELSIFDVLPRYGVLAQLEVLRLPSLREVDDVRVVQRVLDRMPRLQRLEIARLYHGAPPLALRHGQAEIVVPPVSSWPPLDQVDEDLRLTIDKVELEVAAALFAMERYHGSLAPPARAAWDEIWTTFRATSGTLRLSAATLYRACDALVEIDDYLVDDAIGELADAVRADAIADKIIKLKRA